MKPIILGLLLHSAQLSYGESTMDKTKFHCTGPTACVSSIESEGDKYIPPFKMTDIHKTQKALLSVLENSTRTKITYKDENTIKAEFTSLVFRFKDNVQFFLDESDSTLHWKSQSKMGRYDFGVNRKRLETIRTSLHQGLKGQN